jgi:hypothetical protein
MKGIVAALAIWVGATIPALAQDAARLSLVGVMVTGSASAPAAKRFREALAAAGYVEGRDLRLDFRVTETAKRSKNHALRTHAVAISGAGPANGLTPNAAIFVPSTAR